jgi:hypothetical protein
MRKKLGNPGSSADQPDLMETDLQTRHVAQRERCGARLGMTEDAIERMVNEFAKSHGGVTLCPPAYAATSRQYNLRPSH